VNVSALVTPNGVSRRIYVDDAIYRAELDKIFGTTWVYVAHESELAQSGDYKTTQIGETPVIVAREEGRAGRAHQPLHASRRYGLSKPARQCNVFPLPISRLDVR
jgi:hypothetical protein